MPEITLKNDALEIKVKIPGAESGTSGRRETRIPCCGI